MIKKTLFTLGGAGLLMVVLVGRDATSYVRTSYGWVRTSVKSSVPTEFEIERARQMVKNMEPDIRKNMHIIAQEEVEIERLDKQIAQTLTTLDRDRVEMMKLKDDLAMQKVEYRYAGRIYTVSQVKVDLANRFERYKTHDATLNSLRDMQTARRSSLDAVRQKLDAMLAARRQLGVEVESLDARFRMVEVKQTASEFNIDDSQLGRVKDLIADVRTRLNVAERMANVESQLSGEIPVSTPQNEDIVSAIDEYFGGGLNAARMAEVQFSPAQ